MQSIFLLGRQPALGLAELESLYGPAKITAVGGMAAVVDIDPGEVDFERLGGSIKFGRVLSELDTVEWRDIERHLVKAAPSHAEMLADENHKLTIGISAYGLRANPATINATGLSVKKAIRRSSGRSVRLVPNKETEMNTAQVLHNNLTGENGWELLLVRSGNKTILAQTVRVQDIESYTIRDRERPKRDARVGMLPPKLAQIIINLARPTKGGIVLDPFCGTGVLLQEALLMGFGVYGSDLEPRMIDYTWTNIEWLKNLQPWLAKNIDEHKSTHVFLEVQDATTFLNHDVIDSVASETYLGRPFTSLPSPEILNQTVSECNLIIKKFLRSISSQLPAGTRLCLAVPAWQTRPRDFKHLPLLSRDLSGRLDQIQDMGYNRISFEHVRQEELLYYREDQVVARELLVLEKK